MAWEFPTARLALPKDMLYATYFGGDKELGLEPGNQTRDIWLGLGLSDNHLIPYGMNDNFWEVDEAGSCGRYTEINFDRIGDWDASSLVNGDDPDVAEIWKPDGSLTSLPRRHMDTRMGLERLASNTDKPTTVPIYLSQSSTQYSRSGVSQVVWLAYLRMVCREPVRDLTRGELVSSTSTRWIWPTGSWPITSVRWSSHCPMVADHITRAEGPGDGKLCVFRRLIVFVWSQLSPAPFLRRAIRYASEILHAKPGFLGILAYVAIDLLGDAFPKVRNSADIVKSVIDMEETQFLRALLRGGRLLDRTIRDTGDSEAIPGEIAWCLYDKYGFPINPTQLMVEERTWTIDGAKCKEAKQKFYVASLKTGAKL